MSFLIPAQECTPKAVDFGCCCVCCWLFNLCAPEFLFLRGAGVERDTKQRNRNLLSPQKLAFFTYLQTMSCSGSALELHHTILFLFCVPDPFSPLSEFALLVFYNAEQRWIPCPPLSFGKDNLCCISKHFCTLYSYPPPPPICCSFRGAFRGAFLFFL